MTHYLIYKITNRINGKIYIGQHQTDNLDDGYMGSGKRLWLAYRKYGIDNFSKEILFYCTDWKTMNRVEELLVDEDFVKREDTYNMALGGMGGFCGMPKSEEAKKKISNFRKGKTPWNKGKLGLGNGMYGKHHSEDSKKKMSKSHKGVLKSEETKKRMSEAHKGKHRGKHATGVLKMIEANRGKHLSEAHKKKLSEANKRYWALMKGN